jgi:hypothetical protein
LVVALARSLSRSTLPYISAKLSAAHLVCQGGVNIFAQSFGAALLMSTAAHTSALRIVHFGDSLHHFVRALLVRYDYAGEFSDQWNARAWSRPRVQDKVVELVLPARGEQQLLLCSHLKLPCCIKWLFCLHLMSTMLHQVVVAHVCHAGLHACVCNRVYASACACACD